ncbi:endopeptidase La [Papillibacter cinnamivorans]|uniref:Lon protease n=1 Tax=Papillibacter cinnamivorans DSM 12816 TaxID=1122930 RepID=A0A1W1YUD1_9FIRM|nr:endopeptidase La [Papillibacter cinnamivorans]SMC39820.1 ATP-dependent Lon protease [Papillibacter cinnamivorans DSM 12816]
MNKPLPIETMPMLALRGLTIFPNMLLHFDVGRDISIRALDEAMSSGQKIFLVAQREIATETPEESDLFRIGTISNVRQILRLPGDAVRVMVEGKQRGKLLGLEQTSPYFLARVEELSSEETPKMTVRAEAMLRRCYALFQEYAELAPKMTPDVMLNVVSGQDPGYVADYIAQNIAVKHRDKQAILEELHPISRLKLINDILQREIEILTLEHDLQNKIREHIGKNQRDYILKEQIKVLQGELEEGGSTPGDDTGSRPEEYRSRILKLRLSRETEEKLLKEVARMSRQPFGSSELAVVQNYLDAVLELPWNKYSKERVDVAAARKILDSDHYGLEKVKERILEFLAVRQLAPDLKGQILCLVGPPGVGKTSVAVSVAKALNRKLARLSLGGVRDEADIRGHRKTYVGAMPGRIMTAVRQGGTMNPLMLLDEIDKLGSDGRGDPSSALLEVLDAEQNSAFRDHFLEIPFDLSSVMFITTANTTETIPRPLLDRMEVIELTSYTDEEKLQIAKRHLLPKQMKKHGLKRNVLRVSDDAVREIISGYTRESGVRLLERELAAVCRKAAMAVVSGEASRLSVTAENLEQYLGVRKFHPERRSSKREVGVVTGLAWTSVGGEILEVEVNIVEGTGKIELTGNLGDVMKESAKAAMSYIRSRAQALGVDPEFYKNRDIHVHFPEGAVPKDGPSAGITIATAMVSALTDTPVRRDIAMTGEITLRGRVLPIGGLKEKTMAALRSGVKTVILPAENEKDLEEIDQTVRNSLHFVLVEHIDAVLAEALYSFKLIQGDPEEPSFRCPGADPDVGVPLKQ